jgi:hypothetical protein
MLGADAELYVVKFQNNPQHVRVLANELLASRLGALVGLSVPACEVVEVTQWLVDHTPELDMELGHSREVCRPGLQFGSRLVGGLMPGQLVTTRRTSTWSRCGTRVSLRGCWRSTSGPAMNGRQAVFHKK